MTRTRLGTAATGATIFILGQLVLAAPVGAVDAPATVTADMPSAVPAGRIWAFNDFFPRTVTVRTGTDLQFINQGFHTFTVLPTSGTTAKQDQHGNGVALSDTDDTTRNLNGTTHAVLNNAALGPTSTTCGAPTAPCSFDGTAVVSSGVPAGPPAPFVVHVAASPGTYVFVCRVHAGMTGKLKVVAASAEVPSATQVQHQIAKQIAKDLKGAWAADRHASQDAEVENHDRSRTWHVTAGTSSRDGKVALLEFFPRNLDARPGDKVVFTPKSPNEPHTVTFPGDSGTSSSRSARPARRISRSARPAATSVHRTRSSSTAAMASGSSRRRRRPRIPGSSVHDDLRRTSAWRGPRSSTSGRSRSPARRRHVHLRVPDPRGDGGDDHRPLTRVPRIGSGSGPGPSR